VREEQRLRVFENRVLRRVSGAMGDDATEVWGKRHNEDLHVLYSSSDIIWLIQSRGMRWEGHVANIGDRRCIQGFGGETRGKQTTGKAYA
jgi:hypothetical protein